MITRKGFLSGLLAMFTASCVPEAAMAARGKYYFEFTRTDPWEEFWFTHEDVFRLGFVRRSLRPLAVSGEIMPGCSVALEYLEYLIRTDGAPARKEALDVVYARLASRGVRISTWGIN